LTPPQRNGTKKHENPSNYGSRHWGWSVETKEDWHKSCHIKLVMRRANMSWRYKITYQIGHTNWNVFNQVWKIFPSLKRKKWSFPRGNRWISIPENIQFHSPTYSRPLISPLNNRNYIEFRDSTIVLIKIHDSRYYMVIGTYLLSYSVPQRFVVLLFFFGLRAVQILSGQPQYRKKTRINMLNCL